MRTFRVFSLVMASVLALAVTGCGATFKQDGPKAAVRDFLSEALAMHNGQRACDYLTQAAQSKLAAADGVPGAVCRSSLEGAFLAHDGREVQSSDDVKALDYTAQEQGHDRATVTVTAKGGARLVLSLKRDDGLGNLYEPKTPWRIVDGAEPLVTGRSG